MSSKPTLLWLEDVPKTAIEILYSATDRFRVKRVDKLHDFAKILDDPSHTVKGIILDVMLYGIYNLSDLGIQEEVDTDRGTEAGWRILQHYLRASEPKLRKIPVLVLSMRSLKEENKELMKRLTQAKDAPITYLEKRSLENEKGEKRNWLDDFKKWLNEIG